MPYEVFISHSSKDKKAADLICGYLEQKKIRCWIAPRDLQPGDKWAAGIISGLDQCQAMVLVFTMHSNVSSQVAREVERAASKGITIFPLRLDDTPLAPEMEYFISNTHWLDALTDPVEEHLHTLHQSLRAQLDIKKGAPTAPAPPPPEPRPEGSAADVLIWQIKQASRQHLLPLWAAMKRLSPAYKMILGSLAAVIMLLIFISRNVGPPSPEKIRAQMQAALKEGERMTAKIQEEAAAYKAASDALQGLDFWPHPMNGHTDQQPPWWREAKEAYLRNVSAAHSLTGDNLKQTAARLKAEHAQLQQRYATCIEIQPRLAALVRRIQVRAELARRDPAFAHNNQAATAAATAAEKALAQGDVAIAAEQLAATAIALPAPVFPLEALLTHVVDEEASTYQKSIHSLTDLRQFTNTFLAAWDRSYRGLRLGMTAAEMARWAQSLGATWVVEGNFAAPNGAENNTNAVTMTFPVPWKDGSLNCETVTLSFTQHLSTELPSVIYNIQIQNDFAANISTTPAAWITEQWGSAVRRNNSELIYAGPDLRSVSPWQNHVPENTVQSRERSYQFTLASSPLRQLYRNAWDLTVQRSKSVDELPQNPLLTGKYISIDPQKFHLKEKPWDIRYGMPRAEMEAQATANGESFSNNGNQLYVYIKAKTGMGIRMLCRDRDQPDAISWVEYQGPPDGPTAPLAALQHYIARYGPPRDAKITSQYARLAYYRHQGWEFDLGLAWPDGQTCRQVHLEAGYED